MAIERFSPGPGAPVGQLFVTDTSLLAITLGALTTFDTENGSLLSERLSVGVTDALELPSVERLAVDTRELEDRDLAAELVAEALDDDLERITDLFALDGFVVVDAWLGEDAADAVRKAIATDDLPGAELERGPLLAVADHAGISVLDAWTLDPIDEIPIEAGVTALTLADPDSNEPTLYAATGASLETIAFDDDGPGSPETMWMPGDIRDLAWNESARLVHAVGEAPEGGPTVYAIEPRGGSVFIDVPLPEEPTRLLPDTQAERPDVDRTELLAIAADGSLTSVGVGGNAFGWRLPGVLLGVLAAALLYLLAQGLVRKAKRRSYRGRPARC